MASPVDECKIVPVGTIQTNGGSEISAVNKLSFAATVKREERESVCDSGRNEQHMST